MVKTVDKMNVKERIKGLILNRPIDRVPFMPFFVSYMAMENGLSLRDFFSEPELAFRAGEATMRKHPWANIRPVYGWGDHGAWEFGGKIRWPDNDVTMTPYTPEPLISSPEEIEQLAEPDPTQTEWFRLRDRFNQLCMQNGHSVHLPSGSIFAQVASIVGIQRLMKWTIKHPDAIHQLAKKVLRLNVSMAEVTMERYGAQNCSVMTDLPMESNDLISPPIFEKFCLPYILELHGLFLERGVRSVMIHLCGNHTENLKYWMQVPLPERTIFSISSSMDLETTGKVIGERHILAGNISSTTIQFGTQEEVKKEAKRCLSQGKGRAGGFILMPACEWPPKAPPQNLEVIRQTIMEDGFY